MTNAKTIRIPTRFYDDHLGRDLPGPAILRSTKSHYFISANDKHLMDLKDDAEYYSSDAIDTRDFPELFGIKASARATLKAIRSAQTA